MSLPFGRERPERSIIIAVAVICVAALVLMLALRDRGPGAGSAGPAARVDSVAMAGLGDGAGTDAGPGGTTDGLSPARRRELDRLATLGYIAGSVPVPERVGVVRHDPGRTYNGHTLLSFARGRPEAVLIDMDGHIVHSWTVPDVDYLSRVHLFPNGDLLALTNEPYSIVRLDRNSRLLWRYADWPHHDFRVLPDGRVCAIIRSVTTRSHIAGGEHLIDDHIVLLDEDGRELLRASVLEAFEASERWSAWLMDGRLSEPPDIFHTNSVDVASVEPEMRALLSIRSLDAVAMVNVDRGAIEWVLTGPWHRQHEARYVGERILLFDNLGLGDRSRVIEIDPASAEVLWSYDAEGFFSKGAGAQQRLPNGNTLITESDGGRLLEVTRSGDVVWEYINPHTVSQPDPVVLGIMRAVRLPEDFPTSWATR